LVFAIIAFFLINGASAGENLKEKESARTLFELNKTSFSEKEIRQNKSICDFQNELAEKIGENKYECTPSRAELNDTQKGDRYVVQTLKQVQSLSKTPNAVENYQKKQMNRIMDKAIKKLR
jgi:hypothetical protein